MRLKDYGRNQKKRKEDIHQSGLLITGLDENAEGLQAERIGHHRHKSIQLSLVVFGCFSNSGPRSNPHAEPTRVSISN